MLDLIHDIEISLEGGDGAELLPDRQEAKETRRSVARMSRALSLTVALFIVFSSARLVTWVNGFEVGPVQNAIVALSATWNEQMARNGLSAPEALLREGMSALRRTTWEDVKARVERERAKTEDATRLLRGMISDRKG
ncbi:MAG: hypothetical protein CVT73_25350 [Alphaproteobacteria bacterium HGW-Alphaproteobacteria-12]|nr:MAG: hypothetical protein CVT73_25350 [Alphaproteobacteria bacterium HGW-Alphaproteobacteria-12]